MPNASVNTALTIGRSWLYAVATVATRLGHIHTSSRGGSLRFPIPREIIIAGPSFRKLHPPLGSGQTLFSKYLFTRVSRRYNITTQKQKHTMADPNNIGNARSRVTQIIRLLFAEILRS